jgi:tRNA A22 N-methylase
VDAAMTFLLGDGLLPLGERRAEVATLAGVGGALVGRMVREQRPEQYGIGRVVAQPMSEERVLRAMVSESDWAIVEERLVVEGGLLFCVAVLEPGRSPRYTVEDIVLGPCLRTSTDAVWVAWLDVQRRWLRARVRARAAARSLGPPPAGVPPQPAPAGAPWPVDGTEPVLDAALHLQIVETAWVRVCGGAPG